MQVRLTITVEEEKLKGETEQECKERALDRVTNALDNSLVYAWVELEES